MVKVKGCTIINKPDIMPCWRCDGKGIVPSFLGGKLAIFASTIKDSRDICPLCEGTGKWVENHYIVIDNKNKIAIDSDTGG